MRFRLFGDLDCPDWILADIVLLSRLTSIKLKLLAKQVVENIVQKTLDFEKCQRLSADAKFKDGDVKACINTLRHILVSAGRNDVADEVLSHELQQLGLPKEHTSMLCSVYLENAALIQERLRAESLRINPVQDMQWRVEEAVGSSEKKATFVFRTPDEAMPVTMTAQQVHLLLKEMKEARGVLSNFRSTSS